MESTNVKQILEVAEVKLSYKSKGKASRPKITGSKDARNVLRQYWDTDKLGLVEQFKVMLLNRANQVVGLLDLSTGSTTGTIADPRLIFCTALKGNATGIIVAHNHPSGNLRLARQILLSPISSKKPRVFLRFSCWIYHYHRRILYIICG